MTADLLICRIVRSKVRCRVGDLVVFRMPIEEDTRVMGVKRVAGLGGDVVEGLDGPMRVPPGHLFVRAEESSGVDSRVLGPLPRGRLRGLCCSSCVRDPRRAN